MAEDSLSIMAQGLTTRLIGHPILYYSSVSSTQDVAKEVALRGAKEGTVVIAEEQTAGRGRLERAWISSRGNLALSVVLRPPAHLLTFLTMLAPLAVVRAIEREVPLKPDIKWPNDVLINGRKVCGVLIENSFRGQELSYAVMGIGLNVNLDPLAHAEIATIATSLRAKLGRPVSCLALGQALLEELDGLYLGLKAGADVFTPWRQRLVTLGQHVLISGPGLAEEGIAEAVDSDGSLLLRRADGSLLQFSAGEVSLRSRG